MGIWFGAVESLGTLGALHRNTTLFNTLVVIFMFCTVLIFSPTVWFGVLLGYKTGTKTEAQQNQ